MDHFLAWNESLRPIGKLIIAAVILECEAKWLQSSRNHNHPIGEKLRDDWYRFLVHKIVYDCKKSSDLFNNKIKFIIFNYDISLERILYTAISTMDLFDAEDVLKFLANDRLIHVYGAVHSGATPNGLGIDLAVASKLGDATDNVVEGQTSINDRKLLIDRCYESAQQIRTIDPHDKEEDAASLQTAQKWIAEAGVVYILGYGFDDNNNRRIGLDKLRHGKHNGAIMFTNYNNLNVINKKTSKLFFGHATAFIEGSVVGNPKDGFYAEKSVRNVYDALNMDFDALENELTASTKI